MAKSCSGFCPSPWPPNDLGIAKRSAKSSDFTTPLRPWPDAVACAVCCVHPLALVEGWKTPTYLAVLEDDSFFSLCTSSGYIGSCLFGKGLTRCVLEKCARSNRNHTVRYGLDWHSSDAQQQPPLTTNVLHWLLACHSGT